MAISAGTIKLTFFDHLYNGGGWRTPTENIPNPDPVVCLNNNVRYDCDAVNGPLDITIKGINVVVGSNKIKLDT